MTIVVETCNTSLWLTNLHYGSIPTPPQDVKKIVQVSNRVALKNQDTIEKKTEYDEWNIKDKIVTSWIYSSMIHNYLKYRIEKVRWIL